MITSATGDLLAADAEALVNTVNCVGVMGKGIALQFKRRYPNVFKTYQQACKSGEVQIGRMLVVPTQELDGPRYVINFPTKKHWKSPSDLKYIQLGLEDLRRVIGELQLSSIAIPPLGAGNGGLSWSEVAPLIETALADLPDIDVQVFAPALQHRAVAPGRNLRLTQSRAVLLYLLRSYVHQRQTLEPWEDLHGASHLELQKLMYFANEFEPRLRLDFTQGRYGPYSEKVRHLIQDMEGTYLTGFGDGTGRALALEPIAATAEANEQLDEYLKSNAEVVRDLEPKLLNLISGFEGPYGVELLASTHWVATKEGRDRPETAALSVRGWTKRKGRIFTDAHVASALMRLGDSFGMASADEQP